MNTELVVLGSGTCVPMADRFPSAYAVSAQGLSGLLLLDLGSGALQRLAQAGLSYRDIAHVVVTHAHPDHCAGLIPLIQALNYTPGYTRREPLTVYGPHEVNERLTAELALNPRLAPRYPFDFITVGDQSRVALGEAGMEFRSLEHSTPTVGVRIELGDATLAYVTDTGPCEAIGTLARDADLAAIECSYPAGESSAAHLSATDVGAAASAANPRHILLTHLYPAAAALSPEILADQVRAGGYHGHITKAEDMLRIPIRASATRS